MRKLILGLAALGLVGAGGLALVGCPAAHDDYPGTACKKDSDCFLGEMCGTDGVCAPIPPDMSMDMAFPSFDFAHPKDMPTDDGATTPDDLSGGDL